VKNGLTVIAGQAATPYLDQDALDLIEGELIVAAVVEPRRAGALMVGHLLRDFQLAAVAQVLGDAGRAERVTADLRRDAGDLARGRSSGTRRLGSSAL
jgi:hypothetical protein